MVIGCRRLSDVSVIYRVVNPHLMCPKYLGVRSMNGQGNKFELIPTVKMETSNPVEGSRRGLFW